MGEKNDELIFGQLRQLQGVSTWQLVIEVGRSTEKCEQRTYLRED